MHHIFEIIKAEIMGRGVRWAIINYNGKKTVTNQIQVKFWNAIKRLSNQRETRNISIPCVEGLT